MQLSPIFNSSTHCKASHNGRFIATISTSSITIRSTNTLRVVNAVKIPSDFAGPVSSFLWSPSSSKILISAADSIYILSAFEPSFQAKICHLALTGGKLPVIRFGSSDFQVLVFSAFGLKLHIFDLQTSKAIEIPNPKFYQPISVSRGFSIRASTSHLALLTRVDGKDVVSIHSPETHQLQRSWHPETLDAQGLVWTPNGQWLLLWESPAHGSRLLLYTPDGQHFRTIGASSLLRQGDADLEPGIKFCALSSDSELCVVGDHSRGVAVLQTSSWSTRMRLFHPTTIVPQDTLQVWQEQLGRDMQDLTTHTFLRATQMISPPVMNSDILASGCSLAAFDVSSTLLATRLDDSPCTLWIWDVSAMELRAVLIFHSSVAFHWHPSSRELLLVNCQDETYRGVSFVWDPLSNGPMLATEGHLPGGNTASKKQVAWVDRDSEFPELLLSDTKHFALLSLSDSSQCSNPWERLGGSDFDQIPSCQRTSSAIQATLPVEADEASLLDDTFSFRNI